MIFSNVVKKDELREVQLATMEVIKEALTCSFGPMGSNTAIKKDNMLNKYSKDGHTILSNLMFKGTIEQSVKDDLEDLTRHIVKTVGDGTTSAIILSAIIFKGLSELKTDASPYQIIRAFKDCVEEIVEEIRSNAKEATPETIFDVAYISTNGNFEIAMNLRDIYKEYGMDVFIDVGISNTTDSLIKVYDGMTLESGYADTAFINNKKGTSELRNPNIYVFEDPIDTPELIALFDKIIATNILAPYQTQMLEAVVPTVILAPKLSKDMSSYMERLVEFMYSIEDTKMRPPFLLVTNIYHHDQFMDIAKLCGAKLIKKYIDPKIQQTDIANGLAPTLETVTDFFGTCDMVESDVAKTKFINPKNMFNEDGSYSQTFNTMVEFLEAELRKGIEEGKDANFSGTLKRRINSLKANMVEYLVGGVTMSDRDSVRDLVEDAVLNARSTARNGYGCGANYEGLRASHMVESDDPLESVILNTISAAYMELTRTLYGTCMSREEASENAIHSLVKGCPMNLRTKEFDNRVLSTIDSDIVILETISKIVTLMFTCNQFIVQTPLHNTYIKEKDIK